MLLKHFSLYKLLKRREKHKKYSRRIKRAKILGQPTRYFGLDEHVHNFSIHKISSCIYFYGRYNWNRLNTGSYFVVPGDIKVFRTGS